MVTSSLSPERAETMAPQPACARRVEGGACVSVSVPAWLGLMRAVLHAPPRRRFGDARGVGDQQVVADDLHALAGGAR